MLLLPGSLSWHAGLLLFLWALRSYLFMANRWGKLETVADFIFLGSKITVYSDCNRKIKRRLLLGVVQSRTWLSDFTFTFHFHALEKEMATHSSILAWRIPGTEEPVGLLSYGVRKTKNFGAQKRNCGVIKENWFKRGGRKLACSLMHWESST